MKRPHFATAMSLLAAGIFLSWQPPCSALDYVSCRPGIQGNLNTNAASPLVVTIDTTRKHQTINGFGASDAWSTQFVGQWPDEQREAIADLLFETNLDASNNPKGIALSAWRFNLGAGSSRESNIRDTWRKADTYLNEDFTGYDWTRCPGQRWFLQAAQARGVERFTAFVNSPPINMTKNGRAYCNSVSGSTNLRIDKTEAFATYLATILQHFHDVEGIEFDAISPFNEPNWQWEGNSQEGCRYANADIARVVKALYPHLQSRQLATQIDVPEAGDIGYLYGYSNQRGDYIDAFFSLTSPYYIADMIAPQIAAHSYFTCWPEDGRLVGWRQTLRFNLNRYPNLGYAMTEYCILIPDGSWVPARHRNYGSGRDLGIDPALWIARVIHHDLAIAEAASWDWWLAVSPYNYKDGLVYIDKRTLKGNHYESKMLWAMGNFSRFIRPGMSRVTTRRSDGATPEQTTTDLMVSAYHKQDDNTVVAVFVNWTDTVKPVRLRFLGAGVQSLIPYVTSETESLTAYRALDLGDTAAIPPRSIVTFVGLPADLAAD
jgi:O-glycosyl hydrolase